MRNFNLFCILFTVFCFQAGSLQAQPDNAGDSAWQNDQIASATAVYENRFSGVNSAVYEGYQYVPFILPATGDPFYPTNEWHRGSVSYKGKVYVQLPLLYDILKDQLILQSANGLYRILLNSAKVGWFTLDSLRFVHIIASYTMNGDIPKPGYYEQLVKGDPVQLLVKRQKFVVVPSGSGQTRTFRSQNMYYIKKKNKFYKVRSRHSVMKALKDKKREIRRYLRKHKIYFSTGREHAIEQAVIFYNKTKDNAS